MQIFLNEQHLTIEVGLTLFELREQEKPDADVLILNGFPVQSNISLSAGDQVVLIRRGERPSNQELEALMRSRHTPGVHQRICHKTVGIAGAGGLGSNIAVALARMGVGTLLIADFDIIEPSNLNRQQYFIDQIGEPKVMALQENLARINPIIKVVPINEKITPENLMNHFGHVDVMVEAFDAPDQKAMLTSFFLKNCRETPLVAASGMAGFGASNSILTKKAAANFYLVGDGSTAAEPGCGLMAPRVGIAAHHQANAVLRLLLGEEPQ